MLTEPGPAESAPRSARGLIGELRSNGTFAVAVGLLVLGLSSYGFLTVGARGTSTAEFSVVATLWSLLFALANGLFSPLEQEATRAVAQRVARGEAIGPAVRRVSAIGAAIGAVVAVVLLLGQDLVARRIFAGHRDLVIVLLLALLASGTAFVGRGVLAGTQRYWSYSAELAAEGLVRVAGAGVLVVAGTASATGLGLAVSLPPWLVVAVMLVMLPRPGGSHRAGSWTEVTGNLGWLVIAAVFSQGMSNVGPIVLQLIGGDDPGLAGRFLAAFVVVRIPVFFTSALQASFLPRLVIAVEAGDRQALVAVLRQAMTLIGALGALALVVFGVAGPLLVRLLFGPRYPASAGDMVALGVSSVLLVAATMLQSAVLAFGGHRVVAACWALGGVIFTVGCLLPVAPVARLEIAYAVSTALVTTLLSWWLAMRAREGSGALNRRSE